MLFGVHQMRADVVLDHLRHQPSHGTARTGDQVPVIEKVVPFFKTGKEMRERLNKTPQA